jgi:hypothetical protein
MVLAIHWYLHFEGAELIKQTLKKQTALNTFWIDFYYITWLVCAFLCVVKEHNILISFGREAL